jgi:hypothetical protein
MPSCACCNSNWTHSQQHEEGGTRAASSTALTVGLHVLHLCLMVCFANSDLKAEGCVMSINLQQPSY